MPFVQGQQISTHTLRVEGDCPLPSTTSTRWTSFYPRPHMEGDCLTGSRSSYFYPRPPHGGRLKHGKNTVSPEQFLPTPSRRGRPTQNNLKTTHRKFLPTPSRRGRLDTLSWSGITGEFLPTPSAWRATLYLPNTLLCKTDFYPRPRVEGDLFVYDRRRREMISTHALA